MGWRVGGGGGLPEGAGPAPGHRRNHRDLRALRGRRVEPLGETNVLVAHIDIDEPPDLARVVEDAGRDAGVVGVQIGDDLAERISRGLDLRVAPGVAPQNRRYPNIYAHPRPAFRNASSEGAML